MAIFAIITQPNPNSQNLPSAIAKAFPDSHLQIGEKNWLVATTGTARELSDKLGITDGSNGAAIVILMAGYYGRASNDIWNWVKAKWEATSDNG